MTGHAKVYGASDDLIEVEGDIDEEFNGYDTDERPGYLAFSDGTILRAQYGINDEGCWRITQLRMPGGTQHSHTTGVEDGEYSDVVEMTTPEPLRCVVYGRDLAFLGGPVEPVGWTRVSGHGGVIILEGDCPARFDVDSYETEILVYLGLSDGMALDCRCGESTRQIWRFSVLHVPASTTIVHTPCPVGGIEATEAVEIRAASPIGGAVCGDCIGVRGR